DRARSAWLFRCFATRGGFCLASSGGTQSILAQSGGYDLAVANASTSESLSVDDFEQRSAYFDGAARYTPYLATAAGGALFLVKTEDQHIGRSLFAKQGRG